MKVSQRRGFNFNVIATAYMQVVDYQAITAERVQLLNCITIGIH